MYFYNCIWEFSRNENQRIEAYKPYVVINNSVDFLLYSRIIIYREDVPFVEYYSSNNEIDTNIFSNLPNKQWFIKSHNFNSLTFSLNNIGLGPAKDIKLN
jgi:hypothetical protein